MKKININSLKGNNYLKKIQNMKLMTRLFISFSIVLVLLITVVGLEINTLKKIRDSKTRLVNVLLVNENAMLTNKWAMDYFDTRNEDSAEKAENYTTETAKALNNGLAIFESKADKEAITRMNASLYEYQQSFAKYQSYMDKNDRYFSTMEKYIYLIQQELEKLEIRQKKGFSEFSEEFIEKSESEFFSPTLMATDMNNEYEEVIANGSAVVVTQEIMAAEINFWLTGEQEYDDELYKKVAELKDITMWLGFNLEDNQDRQSIELVRSFINDYTDAYENFKELRSNQIKEKEYLNALATEITNESNRMSVAEQDKMENDMLLAFITAMVLGFASIVFGVVLVLIISKSIAKLISKNVSSLSKSSDNISSASAQLASSSHQLSEGSTEEAASIEETSATMEETASMIRQNAQNTHQANELSEQTTEAAQDGAEKMEKMIQSMAELKKSSVEISKIIKVIDDIAFQTNMLALNAAVEAARAGDAGLGFAVVANEVRNLAQKSADAASETEAIIDHNIELSEQGVAISYEVNKALDLIMEKANDVNHLMSEVSAASDEQTKGTAQIASAIEQMEKVVHTTAATAQESAASASELDKEASALKVVVEQLEKLVRGAKTVDDKINLKKKRKTRKDKKRKQKQETLIIDNINQPKIKKQEASADEIIPLDSDGEF